MQSWYHIKKKKLICTEIGHIFCTSIFNISCNSCFNVCNSLILSWWKVVVQVVFFLLLDFPFLYKKMQRQSSLSCKNWLCEMLLKCCELLFCDKWCDWSSRVSSDISVSPRGGKSQTMFLSAQPGTGKPQRVFYLSDHLSTCRRSCNDLFWM